MKRDQIKKNLNHRVKLRPIAKRFNNDAEIERFDDDWVIEGILDKTFLSSKDSFDDGALFS